MVISIKITIENSKIHWNNYIINSDTKELLGTIFGIKHIILLEYDIGEVNYRMKFYKETYIYDSWFDKIYNI